MDEVKGAWVRSWPAKAQSDLRSARALAALSEPATDTAVYHCQQTAEKALKAYLAFRDQPLERTHDLERLLEIAMALAPDFARLEEFAAALNPYAVAFRYPDSLGVQFPSVPETTAAIDHAQAVLDFVIGQFPEDAPSGSLPNAS